MSGNGPNDGGDDGDAAATYAIVCFRAVARIMDDLGAMATPLSERQRVTVEIAALMGAAASRAIIHLRQPREIAAAAFAMSAYDVFNAVAGYDGR